MGMRGGRLTSSPPQRTGRASFCGRMERLVGKDRKIQLPRFVPPGTIVTITWEVGHYEE